MGSTKARRFCTGACLWAIASLTHHTGRALAQITYEGCVDARGIPVASVRNDQLNDVALATLGPAGQPIILYNTRVLGWLSPQTRLFIYAHECGHHALGHPLQGIRLGQEQEADCWGIRSVVEAGLLNEYGVRVVQQDIARFGSGDWTHLPGPVRSINLSRCLAGDGDGGVTDQHPVATPTQFCCDQFARPRCQLAVPSQPGAPCWCPGIMGTGFICQ